MHKQFILVIATPGNYKNSELQNSGVADDGSIWALMMTPQKRPAA
jgi:photosystem II stability/assembly factor-like uncharacterized protein